MAHHARPFLPAPGLKRPASRNPGRRGG